MNSKGKVGSMQLPVGGPTAYCTLPAAYFY